jgi:hypothetical protein
MPVQISPRSRKLTQADIDALQSRLKIALPPDYQNFLLDYNAGVPDANRYIAANVTTSVQQFFGISDLDYQDLAWAVTTYEGRLPSGMLPIAHAGGGDLICLSLEDGAIYFWAHEREAPPDQVTSYDNMSRLANSLTEFLDRLTPQAEGDFAQNAQIKSVKLKPGFAEKFKKYMAP